jgi:hypothetical protein
MRWLASRRAIEWLAPPEEEGLSAWGIASENWTAVERLLLTAMAFWVKNP